MSKRKRRKTKVMVNVVPLPLETLTKLREAKAKYGLSIYRTAARAIDIGLPVILGGMEHHVPDKAANETIAVTGTTQVGTITVPEPNQAKP